MNPMKIKPKYGSARLTTSIMEGFAVETHYAEPDETTLAHNLQLCPVYL